MNVNTDDTQDTTSLFFINLMPGLNENKENILSACIELNTGHAALSADAKPDVIDNWKNDIRQYIDIIDAIIKKPGDYLKPDGFTIVSIHPLRDPTSAVDLWCRYLGYHFSQDPGTGNRFIAKPKGAYLSAAAANIAGTRLSISPLVNDAPHISRAHTAFSSAALPKPGPALTENITLDDVSSAVSANWGIGQIKALPEDVIQGIGKAFEENREKHKRRSGLITSQHREQTEQMTAFGIHEHENSLLKNLTNLYLSVNTVENEPPYIQAAIGHLNSQPTLRRFIGTIIDIEVKDVKLPGSVKLDIKNQSSADGSASLQSVFGLSSGGYFGKSTCTNLDKLTYDSQKWIIQAVPVITPMQDDSKKVYSHTYSEYVSNTLLKLKGRSRIISFEPEQASRNLDTASEKLAGTGSINTADLSVSPSFGPSAAAQLQQRLAAARGMKAARQMNNQVGNMHTKGQSLYITDDEFLTTHAPDFTSIAYYEHNLMSGYVIFVRIKDSKGAVVTKWTSICKVTERIKLKGEKTGAKFVTQQLPLSPQAAIHSSDEQNNTTGLKNGFLFNWDGTIASGKNPLHLPEKSNTTATTADKKVSSAEKLSGLYHSNLEFTALSVQTKSLLRTDWFPFKKWQKDEQPELILERAFDTTAAKLKFDSQNIYEYIAAIQYHNGYVPITEEILRANDHLLDEYIATSDPFRRHEHISAPVVTFEKNIYSDADHKVPLKGHLGESALDLVIRLGQLANNDECVRIIQPPPVPSFNTYLWYHIPDDASSAMKDRRMDAKTFYPWYLRYQCPYGSDAAFKATPGACKGNCKDFCGGTDPATVYPGRLNYLPDPVVTGFGLFFFEDSECLLPAGKGLFPTVFCTYKKGDYPQLKPWKLVLKNTGQRTEKQRVEVKVHEQHVIVGLAEGEQVYAILLPTFNLPFAQLYPAAFTDKDFTGTTPGGEYYNSLQSGMSVLSFTYAVQQPTIKPVIKNIELIRYSQDTPGKSPVSVTADIKLYFEHLNLWQNAVSIPGITPTGEMDLYALWDDYSDNMEGPVSAIENKRNRKKIGEGFIHIGEINFNIEANKTDNYDFTQAGEGKTTAVLTSTLRYELENTFQLTYFTNAAFRVRNTSKYARHFTANNIDEKGNEILKETFSTWSDVAFTADPKVPTIQYKPFTNGSGIEASASYLFNNRKPSDFKVRKIVPLKVTDRNRDVINISANRIRIYLEPDGIHNAGKDERLGIIIKRKGSCYNKYLSPYASKAGRDAVTDDSNLKLDLEDDNLELENFPITDDLIDDVYINTFQPITDLTEPAKSSIGLVSYLIKYDDEQHLWYTDVAIKLITHDQQELHNPFVQLFIANHQPFSSNYNHIDLADNTGGYRADNRISNVTPVEFVCIYPGRNIKNPLVLFRKHHDFNFELSGDISSLFFQQYNGGKRLATQFVLVMQKRMEGHFWENITSEIEFSNNPSHTINRVYHSLLPYKTDKIAQNGKKFESQFKLHFRHNILESFRGVIYEVELFNNDAYSADYTNTTNSPQDNSIFEDYLTHTNDISLIKGVRIKDIIIIEKY